MQSVIQRTNRVGVVTKQSYGDTVQIGRTHHHIDGSSYLKDNEETERAV